MNLILIDKNDKVEENKVILRGRRLKHILEILKSVPGDLLTAGRLNGLVGTAEVVNISEESVELDLKLDKQPPRPLDLTLILALPRPIVLNRLLMTVTTLGVKNLFLIHSNQVEKSYWNSPVLDEKSMEEQLILGLEQARDTILPSVNLRKKFKPFVEDELPRIIKGSTALIAHPVIPHASLKAVYGPVTLMIGPERGFIPYEIEMLQKLGLKTFSMGERILKVETAVCSAIGKLFL
ncbi:MAG: 16S rRNA (uracil(1498)-N(3))-methyltransferase [Candidatus Omnitrophota bacterium]